MAVLTSFPQMFIVLGMYNFGCRIDDCKQTKKYWTFQRHCQGSRSVTTKEADHSTLLTKNRHRFWGQCLEYLGYITLDCRQTKKYWTFQRPCQGSRSVTTKEADHSTSSTLLTKNRHWSYSRINCVCHSIRSMFRVLGVYNFGLQTNQKILDLPTALSRIKERDDKRGRSFHKLDSFDRKPASILSHSAHCWIHTWALFSLWEGGRGRVAFFFSFWLTHTCLLWSILSKITFSYISKKMK